MKSRVLLLIDTATQICSVAVSVENGAFFSEKSSSSDSHSSVLHQLIRNVMNLANMDFKDLSGIAVSAGPGSYTGLRIGVSAAKGFCFASDIPLIAINTLDFMAWALKKIKNEINNKVLFIPMIDARRNEVFTAFYDKNLVMVKPPHALLLSENVFNNIEENTTIIVGGNGSNKLLSFVKVRTNLIICEENIHHAKFMIDLSWKKFNEQQFEDVAYFVPYYLKEYMPSKTHIKGLQ